MLIKRRQALFLSKNIELKEKLNEEKTKEKIVYKKSDSCFDYYVLGIACCYSICIYSTFLQN
ncbi:hypothetical protein JCM31739_07480 [Faecalimonas canis]